jgi:hypothetical protein
MASTWTGHELIVWGGLEGSTTLGDGAAYDPTTDRWRVIAPAPLSASFSPMMAWTGQLVILAGGYTSNATSPAPPATGAAAYRP